jgi:hypothetical protein
MALVGNISGSGGTYSTVGITGSVIFAYTDTPSEFPTLPSVGGDVVFFVSGSTTGKNGAVRNVAVFGGDTVVSGSLTIGTGSVKITSNDLQFDGFSTRIEKSGNSLKFFDASNTGGLTLSQLNAGGGGGSGTNFFLDTAGAGKIYTTASTIAFPMGEVGVDEAADKGVGVVFFVSGSAAGDATSLFGGNVVTSGSIVTKTSTGSPSVSLGVNGTVSGSGTFSVGGDILVQGSIKATDGTTAITLATSTGNVTLAGDLAVNGAASADITTTTAAATIFNTTATSLGIGGQATSVSIGASGGTVTIPGNLTVQGTTTTLDTTNLLVEDPLIYFGSGSVGSNNKGGIALASGSSVQDQALIWGRVAADTWGAGRLDVQNGTVSDFTSLTNFLPIRASKFEAGGANAYVSSSNGSDLLINHTTATTFTKAGTNSLQISGYAGGNDPLLMSMTTGDIFLSGSRTILAHNVGRAVELFDDNNRYATFSTIGSGVSTGLKIGSLIGAGTASPMTLSGSAITIQAAGTVAALSGLPGHNLQAVVKKNANNILAVESDGGNNALLYAGADLRLKAAGNDFNFYGNSSNPFLNVTNDGADNAVIAGFITNGNVTLGSQGNGVTTISGSNVQLRFGSSNRVDFQRDSTAVARLAASSNTAPILSTAGVTNSTFTIGTSGGTTDKLILSGTAVEVVAGAAGLKVYRDTAAIASISSPGANQVSLAAETGFTTANVFDATATTVNAFGAATTLTMGAAAGTTATIRGGTLVGNTTTQAVFNTTATTVQAFGAATAISVGAANGTLTSNVSIVPAATNSYDLGTPSLRWRNMYTGDLHLKNDRGNWTIIEEREYLSITNNITGKRYKFVLQEIE